MKNDLLPSIEVRQPSKKRWLRVLETDGAEPYVGRPASRRDLEQFCGDEMALGFQSIVAQVEHILDGGHIAEDEIHPIAERVRELREGGTE